MRVNTEKHPGKRFVVDFLGTCMGLRVRESYCMRQGRGLEFKLLLVYWPKANVRKVVPYDGSLVDTIWLEDLRVVFLVAEKYLKEHCKGSSESGWRLGGPRPICA